LAFTLSWKKSRLPKPEERRELIPMKAAMEADPTESYNQDDASSVAKLRRGVDATGFIRLNVLRLKVGAKVQKKK